MEERLWVRHFPGRSPPLVALHGFTQTGAAFSELGALLRNEVLAPDLPGHGRSASHPASFEAAVDGVTKLLVAAAGALPLLGYSQGGRVALAVALDSPRLVSHLILVSATAGIEDPAERVRRLRIDRARAKRLEAEDLDAFIQVWTGSPMFEGLAHRGEAWQAADRAVRLENTAAGLAAALVGMGQGAQPYYGNQLGSLRMPVLLLTGERDHQYTKLALTMQEAIPQAALRVVADAGHAVIGEQPRRAAGLIAAFLEGDPAAQA